MNRKRRYVFDTNVIVSALLFTESSPGKAFYAALDHGEVLLSSATVLELNEVLSRRKFDRYVTREERGQFLLMLLHEATVIEIDEEVHQCRDPKDDKLLDVAVNGDAAFLVTGDEDLLALHAFRNVQIVTPVQFVASLASRQRKRKGPKKIKRRKGDSTGPNK